MPVKIALMNLDLKMIEYDEAMDRLHEAIRVAVAAADNHDGAPLSELRDIASEINHLIDHNCTRKEMASALALYRGAYQAGIIS